MFCQCRAGRPVSVAGIGAKLMVNPEGASAESPSTGRVVPYGVGSLVTGIYSALPSALLLYFMTDTLAIAPTLAAAGIAIAKLWSVVCDPLVGRASDISVRDGGSRAPFLIWGGLACAVAFALVFAVPSGLQGGAALLYVTAGFVVAVTAYSVYSVPYVALPAEMSDDPHERTRIISVRLAFAFAGGLVGAAGGPAPVGVLGGGRSGYAAMSSVLGVGAGIAALCAWHAVRRLPPRPERAASGNAQVAVWSGLLRRRSFVRLTIPYILIAAAISTLSAALPYYVRYRLGGDESLLGGLFFVMLLSSMVGLPAGAVLARRLGKPLTLALVIGLFSIAVAALTGVWTAAEKMGLAVGPVLVAGMLSAAGFVPSAGGGAAQPGGVLTAVILATALLPVALLAFPLLAAPKLLVRPDGLR
jgi:GPH family glycoside/pentoside/hexuronide:cation symporter